MIVEARAKINWTLEIKGVRPDGYHLLDMLMQPVTLSDELTLIPAEGISLRCESGPGIPCDRRNLAWRAAEALRRETGCGLGVDILLRKRIPSGAGLGGGSADAAAVLLGLNRLWHLGLTRERLESIGLTLGADVPFCVRGGLTRVEGIGEKLESLGQVPPLHLVILQPCEGLSTAEIYAGWHQLEDCPPVHHQRTLEALRHGSPSDLPPSPGNHLETVSLQRQPAIGEALKQLFDLGAPCAQMSGSGSAVFGVFPDAEKADAAAGVLRSRYDRMYRCETADQSILFTR